VNHCVLRISSWALVAGLGLVLLGCGSSHRLGEYTFRDLTVAAIIDAGSEPTVFTDAFIDINPEDLLASAMSAGATLAKEISAGEAQARLDSAMIQVDVPERIRRRTLRRCSEYLHLRSTQDYHGSDFLFDMYVEDYGIDAEAWDAGVYFNINLMVYLIDNKAGVEIWKTRVKERLPFSQSAFGGFSTTADNVITAVALSQFSVEEMAEGFRYLADKTADRVARKLREDFSKSRESK
jgi:hypothetical protein